ncbi:hypothetical protein ACA30_10065 [Virgibacillus soli]|nr:hypothetical protein ACA30_10065 [Virgibacillus soli]
MHSQKMKEQNFSVSLSENWHFTIDPNDLLQLYEIGADLPETTIHATGSWEEQGFGSKTDHEPIGTWKKEREYEGVAWYVKDVFVPEEVSDQYVFLVLRGVRWHTELWIDGMFVGKGESLSSHHRFDITSCIQAGKKQRFVIRVDNTMKYSLHESHIHSYHTSTNWGGITGGIALETEKPYTIQDIHLIPDVKKKSVELRVKIDRRKCQDMSGWTLIAKVIQRDGIMDAEALEVIPEEKNGHFVKQHLHIQLGDEAIFWSPDNPYLYELELILRHHDEVYDVKKTTFGLRNLETAGRQILLNGKPIFLTGYVDCCIFPQTGYPIWDVDYYRMQFRIVKGYGFNHVRLHGWTPPKPFWEAADLEGMLVQTELPHWSKQYLNRRKSANNETHGFLKRELERIIRSLQLHPSFVMLSLGNELISAEGHPQLNEMVQFARKLDCSRLYTDNTGFGELPSLDREGDYFTPTFNWHPPYNIEHAALPDTTLDYEEITRLENKPLIAHEHGQFTMYVRPFEAEKYKGILKPHWLEAINETLEVKNVSERVQDFINATGIHLVRSLKEAMEKARRTNGLAGIQLLDIRDFPGQGHATVGILDVFWDSKQIVKPEEFRQFNEQTILLMRAKKRTYFQGEILSADLEVSHFGEPITSAILLWELKADNKRIEKGRKEVSFISGDGITEIIKVRVPLRSEEARRLTLSASLDYEGKSVTNEWDFWEFPRQKLPQHPERIWTNIGAIRSVLYGARVEGMIGIEQHSFKAEEDVDLLITDQLSRDVLQNLVDGGSVWLMAQKDRQHDEVLTKYLPIFWNYIWFPQQRGTTMGMLVHEHPVLKNFPNDQYSDWHWFHLVDNTVALGMELLPKVKPIVEVIDNFNRAKHLAYAYEVQVGRGKLFVSTFNLANRETMKRPEANYLFFEILQYIQSKEFSPEVRISVGELLGIFKVRSLIEMNYE